MAALRWSRTVGGGAGGGGVGRGGCSRSSAICRALARRIAARSAHVLAVRSSKSSLSAKGNCSTIASRRSEAYSTTQQHMNINKLQARTCLDLYTRRTRSKCLPIAR
eukprot:6214341-Pleurochrysis_carterae.AAC.3